MKCGKKKDRAYKLQRLRAQTKHCESQEESPEDKDDRLTHERRENYCECGNTITDENIEVCGECR